MKTIIIKLTSKQQKNLNKFLGSKVKCEYLGINLTPSEIKKLQKEGSSHNLKIYSTPPDLLLHDAPIHI